MGLDVSDAKAQESRANAVRVKKEETRRATPRGFVGESVSEKRR